MARLSVNQHIASGARFIPSGFSVALRARRFGERYRVEYRGRSIVVIHNDFGPAIQSRCADLSQGAARALHMRGVAVVRITRLN
jgi:rare lipoprotein A